MYKIIIIALIAVYSVRAQSLRIGVSGILYDKETFFKGPSFNFLYMRKLKNMSVALGFAYDNDKEKPEIKLLATKRRKFLTLGIGGGFYGKPTFNMYASYDKLRLVSLVVEGAINDEPKISIGICFRVDDIRPLLKVINPFGD